MTAVEIIGKWLYRRYRPVRGDKPRWELLGGIEVVRWLNDAEAILDALEAADYVVEKDDER